jgi:hypothetical protein
MRQLRRSVAVFFESTPNFRWASVFARAVELKPDHFVEAGVVTA